MDHQFVSRAATWWRTEDELFVHDSFSDRAPRIITMEPWHQVVFSSADGEHTIGDFIAVMASEYEDGAPVGLREQIHGIIKTLATEGILELHDDPRPLPPYLAEDYHAATREQRAEQMRADGRIGRR